MTDTIVMNGENVDSKSKDDFKLKSIDKLFELPIATSINNKVFIENVNLLQYSSAPYYKLVTGQSK